MSSGEEKPKPAAQPDGKTMQSTKSDVGMDTYRVACTHKLALLVLWGILQI